MYVKPKFLSDNLEITKKVSQNCICRLSVREYPADGKPANVAQQTRRAYFAKMKHSDHKLNALLPKLLSKCTIHLEVVQRITNSKGEHKSLQKLRCVWNIVRTGYNGQIF